MAAGSTYTPIATTSIGNTTTAAYTFSSISGSYTDLVLVASIGNNSGSGAGGIQIRYNGDTASNYSWTYLIGNGSSAVSGRNSNGTYYDIGMDNDTTSFTAFIIQVMNYSNTTTYKTALSRGNASTVEVGANVSLWRSTSAINSMTVTKANGNFKQGSTLTLYGIAAA
jgi:glutamate 5-kinase